MTNEEKILEMLGAMNSRLDSIDKRLDVVEKTLETHTEMLEEHTRILETHTEMLEADNVALNELIRWADDAQVVVKIPVAQAK